MSVNFDRAAAYYDATRGYSTEVGGEIARAIARTVQATSAARFLEVGVGTGRIALPLAEAGYDVTGVDISTAMMDQLRAKAGSLTSMGQHIRLTLLEADMEALPFADGSFDAVIAAHVFHLVDRPEQAAREALRVLRPDGSLLVCGDIFAGHELMTVNEKWREIVGANYGPIPNSAEASTRILSELRARDPSIVVEDSRPVSWRFETSAAEELEAIRQKLWSNTWMLPDRVFDRCFDELNAWCARTFRGSANDSLPRSAEFLIRRVHRPATT